MSKEIRQDPYPPFEDEQSLKQPDHRLHPVTTASGDTEVIEPSEGELLSDEEINKLYMSAEIPRKGYVENTKALMKASAKAQYLHTKSQYEAKIKEIFKEAMNFPPTLYDYASEPLQSFTEEATRSDIIRHLQSLKERMKPDD